MNKIDRVLGALTDTKTQIKKSSPQRPNRKEHFQIMQADNTGALLARQDLIIQTQQLAARHSEAGINPDSVAMLPLDELVGTHNYLKRLFAEEG